MKFTLNVKGADQTIELFQGVAEKVSNPPVDKWEMIMLRSAQQNFVEQGRPEKWWPLSLRTIAARTAKIKGKRKKKGGSSSILILRDTGQLMQSLTPSGKGMGGVYSIRRKTKIAAFISTDRPGASAHQFGDPNRNLPRRRFLLHQEQDIADYKQVYIDHMLDEV